MVATPEETPMHYAKTATRLREQILRFSGELSAGLPKPARRFVAEMIYGIQARQSVRLTEVGRSLEERIPLRKTQYRLCRQLRRPGLWERLTETLCRMAASRIQELTLLILDISDVAKKYARRMEYLAGVHDGSEGRVATGYWTLQVVGAEPGKSEVLPLYNRLYSQLSPEFRSENQEIKDAVETVSRITRNRGVWVMDRGCDREAILGEMIRKKHLFLVRLRQDRELLYQGRRMSVLEVARACPMLYLESIIKEEGSQAKTLRIEFGSRPVLLPGFEDRLSLVVVRGFGEDPLMLLTNVPLKRARRSLWWAVQSYLTRWTIEETIRFIKQSYQLEDIRLLTYIRLQNMMALVMAAAYFTMAYLSLRTKLRVLTGHVIQAARRLFGVPDFRFYALADGIKTHLFGQKRGLYGGFLTRDPETGQQMLFSP
jgi:hypothetical protein